MKKESPFISLDGIDGTGKSTQCRLLIDWLISNGINAIRCSDPGGTPIGDQLRAILLDPASTMGDRTETLLFMASRAELVHRVVKPALASGTVVIADRFISANVVYQGYAGSLQPDEIRSIGGFSSGGLFPDLTFILDMPVAEAAKRRDRLADRLELRGETYFENVRNGFLAEAGRDTERFVVIDASSNVATIQRELQSHVTKLFIKRGFPAPRVTS